MLFSLIKGSFFEQNSETSYSLTALIKAVVRLLQFYFFGKMTDAHFSKTEGV
jgi:hypothetical protein